MINKNNKGRPACQSLSGEYSRQYGYNHCSEKSASLSARHMAGRGEENNSVVRRPKIGEMVKKVAVAGFVVINILSVALYPTTPALAASYTFTQTDWNTASTSATSTHPGGQSGVTTFYSTSSPYITTGANLSLATSSGSFLQTDWTGGATTTATTAQTGWTYASTTDSQIATSTAGQLSVKVTASSTTQTNDGTTATGFKLSGYATSSTVISGTEDSTSVKLNVYFGTGADGNFDASTYVSGAVTGITKSDLTITIDTNNATKLGTYNFNDFTLPETYILTATGSNKITLYAKGIVTINGTINLKGGDGGAYTTVGTAVAGGGNGGNGGSNDGPYAAAGTGKGPGGIGGGGAPMPAQGTSGGGAGGGFGAAGTNGIYAASVSTGGSLYGSSSDVWYGGSGGGGGQQSAFNSSGAGGAGGGALRIISANAIIINSTGIINANGGNGYTGGTGDGGGGSGGGILLQAGNSISNNGSIQARGGTRGVDKGGYGAGGRVGLETLSGTGISLGTVATSSCAGAAGTVDVCGGGANFGTATTGSIASPQYSSSGTYTSGGIDTGQVSGFTTLTYSTTTNASTTVAINIRAGDDNTPPAWGSFDANWPASASSTSVSSGGSISALSGYRYVQYRATLSTIDTAYTPSLNDITINYQYYPASASLISSAFDTGDAANMISSINWAGATSTNAGIKFQIRASSTEALLANTNWCGPTVCDGTEYFTDIYNGSSTMPSALTAGSGARWFQYKAVFTSNGAASSTLDWGRVDYKRKLSGGTYELKSTPYDATDAANVMGLAGFATSSQPTGTNVQMQIRTASTQGGLESANWCGPTETTCTGGQYFTAASTEIDSNSPLKNGGDDRWWQYRILLTPSSDSLSVPVVDSVTVVYVVNASPVFNSSSAGQGSDGVVTINYNIYDPDTDQGSEGNRYRVTPSFEYSTNTVNWFGIATSSGALTHWQDKGVGTNTAGTATSTLWSAENTLGSNFYSTSVQIRTTISDNEAANATAATTTAAFTIDTKDPTAGGTLLINGSNAAEVSTSTVSVTIGGSLSDDSQVRIQLSNDGVNWYGANATSSVETVAGTWGSATTTGATLGTWNWTLPTNTRSHTVYANIKDVYGNQIQEQASADQNAAPVVSITNSPSISTTASTTSGVIVVNYDLSDPDSSGITPADASATTSLMYDIGITLSSAMSSTAGIYATSTGTNASVVAVNDIIQVDNELMLVSANNSNILTVTRGYRGTTATIHSNGATVWLMANAVSGNVGSSVPLGTGKSISWTPASDKTATSSAARLMVTAIDGRTVNQTGTSTAKTFFFDTIAPVNASPRVIEFDAGAAGETGTNNIAIYHPVDATGTQYMFSATTTDGTASTTPWTTLSGAEPTYLDWGFDTTIGAKSVSIKFRDIYGNTQVATTTATTTIPLSADAFLVQDVSKASQNDWRLYIAWETSTSTDFASYKLEYATSTDNSTFGPFYDVTTIINSATNYYVHTNASSTLYYRYRVGVKTANNNITVRSNSYINAKPDGVQNLGEGGGGTSPSASVVTNIVPTQGADSNVTVTYNLTDSSQSVKTSPSYQRYLLYDVGVALTASSTSTLILSDTTKLPSSGYIQINQEVISYTGNATSTGTLSGITRGTWPGYVSSGRATRVNTTMASSTPVWIFATSTGAAITDTSISSGQSGSITWTTSNDTNLAGYYLTNIGLRVLVHDGQGASSGPLSSQSDQSNDGVLTIFDKKAPVLGASSLLIEGSPYSVETDAATVGLSLANVSGDTSSETIYIQFASGTSPTVWYGANSNGSLASAGSWGEALSVGGNLGPWTWTPSGRSETINTRIKDAYGNISNTDTNSILKNAVPEFGGSISDADALGYATTTSATGVVIRQCNVYDTDPLCTTGKVKIKFTARDADTDLGMETPGSASTTIAISLNGGAYATTSSSVFAVGTSTYSTVTVYYDPQSSANITARVAITDNEVGSALQYAVSNTIAYDKTPPTTGVMTFDAGIAGSADTATITIPTPADATTTQYTFSATTTSGTLSGIGWTTYTAASSTAWGFDSTVGAKSVSFRYRDIYGNTTATATASTLAPPDGNSFVIEDISATTSARLFLSWPASSDADFANYRVEYATSSQESSGYAAFQDLITIPNSAVNYYTHAGLGAGVWYRYRLSVKNSAGNYSVKSVKGSNVYVAGKPDGVQNGDEAYANDTSAPAVTNVSSGTPQVTSATISFSVLDNASLNTKSTVYYAVSSDYNGSANDHRLRYAYKFGNAGYAATANNSTATTTTVTLSNLVKNSIYKFAVETCDVTGNCALKEDTGDAPFTFTTANGPAIVVGPSATNNTYDTTTITWKTDKAADSIAYYSSSVDGNNNLVSPVTAGSNTQITTADVNPPNYYSHSVTLSSLGSGTYYYKARSSDTNGQYSESSVLSVAIPAQATPQMTAAPSCSVTYSTFTANWTTDQDTTTEISVLSANVGDNYFNSTPGAQLNQYPSTSLTTDAAAWTAWRTSADHSKNHSQTFTGLTENTTYYLKARSLNRSSGEVSGLLTCTTTATPAAEVIVVRPPAVDNTPPIISAVEIKDITATTATIAWTTDELADTLVKHGATMSYGSISGTEELSTSHSVMLGGLKPSTAYNFKITSADAKGNRSYSGDQSFTTLSLPEAAQTTKDELEKLQKELKELKEKQESETKKAQSLAEATARFKSILKSVASDVSLQDLEDLTTDISDTISDITQEVTPPNIIGGVPAVEIEANKATIKWRTNKMANSIIALAPQSDYDAQAKDSYTLQVGQAQEEVKDHAVTIPDLKPSTVYHFQIRSKAKVGPEGRSRDFVFETKPELPVIIDYSFKKITENSITVVWRTNVLSSSLVRYTPFSPDGDLLDKESKTQGNPAFVQAHEVAVTNLPPNVAYLVEISSKDVTGAEVSRVLGTVRTIVDVKTPVITKVRAESTLFPGKVEKTQTIIYWETDEPSTSQIFWKEGVSKGDFANSSRLDMEYTTSHVMVMTNFKPGSVYRFQVESVDPAGNKSRSTDYTVLTPKKGETVIDLIINNFQDIFGFLKKM